MGLWPGCTAGGEMDFSCGIHFNIKGISPIHAYHPGLSDLDNKKTSNSGKIFDPEDIKNVYAIFLRQDFKEEHTDLFSQCHLC